MNRSDRVNRFNARKLIEKRNSTSLSYSYFILFTLTKKEKLEFFFIIWLEFEKKTKEWRNATSSIRSNFEWLSNDNDYQIKINIEWKWLSNKNDWMKITEWEWLNNCFSLNSFFSHSYETKLLIETRWWIALIE